MRGYEARIGSTSRRSASNTQGSRNISDTGTDSPASTCRRKAGSSITLRLNAAIDAAPVRMRRARRRRLKEAGAYWPKS